MLCRDVSCCAVQMLARRFLHYQQERPKITGDEKDAEIKGPAPYSLYLLAACMIKVGGANTGCLRQGFIA
jgi:hypothetical protein